MDTYLEDVTILDLNNEISTLKDNLLNISKELDNSTNKFLKKTKEKYYKYISEEDIINTNLENTLTNLVRYLENNINMVENQDIKDELLSDQNQILEILKSKK